MLLTKPGIQNILDVQLVESLSTKKGFMKKMDKRTVKKISSLYSHQNVKGAKNQCPEILSPHGKVTGTKSASRVL